MKLGNLVVEITADSAKFIAGAADTEIKLDNLGKRARSAVNTFGKYSAAATGAGVAVTAALYTKAAQAIDAQAKLAIQLNTTSASMATITRAGELSGIGMEKIATAGRTLTTRLSEIAAGTGPAADSFKRLGLNAEEVAALPLDQRINAINEAIRQNIPATEQAAVAADFFGERMGTAILTLSGDTIAQARRETELFGLSLSDVDAAKVEQANDAFSTFGMAADGIIQQMTVQLAPIIKAISEEFIGATEEAGGFGNVTLNAMETVINAIAFVSDAVDGLKRIFELTADGIISAIAWATQAIAKDIAWVLERISKIPGVDFSETVESLRNFSEEANKIVDEAVNNMDETLSKPLAGEQFRQFVDDARKAGEEAAKAAVEARAAVMQPSGGATGVTMTPEQEARKKQLEQQIEAIRLANMEEMEILNQKQQKELEALREFYEGKNSLRTEFAELEKETLARHEEEKSEIEKRASEIRKRQADEEAKYKQQALATALSNLTSLMNSENRKMFEIGKAAALSQAVIDGYASIVGAYKVGAGIGGPALGAAYGAAAALATSQQINAIRSQSFGGGGGASGSTTQAVNAQTTPVSTQAQQPTQTLLIEGFDPESMFSGTLIEFLLDYQRRGGNIVL